MKIDSIEKAEDLVEKTPSLSWDGWNIIWKKEDPEGYMSTSGVFLNNKWHIKKVFPLIDGQWEISDSVIK